MAAILDLCKLELSHATDIYRNGFLDDQYIYLDTKGHVFMCSGSKVIEHYILLGIF